MVSFHTLEDPIYDFGFLYILTIPLNLVLAIVGGMSLHFIDTQFWIIV